jgi:hypothetical protein
VNILLNFSTSERFKNQGYISICIAILKRLYGFILRVFNTILGGKKKKKRVFIKLIAHEALCIAICIE